MMIRLPHEWWKQPNTYFLLIPIVLGIWTLAAGMVFYPRSVTRWQDQQKEYQDAEEQIKRLLEIDPGRLINKSGKGGTVEFDYSDQIDKFAKVFKMSDKDYMLKTRPILKKSGKKSRSADLIIKTVDIHTLAKFISALQIRWSQLQVDQISLEKLATGKDAWKVTLRLNYIY